MTRSRIRAEILAGDRDEGDLVELCRQLNARYIHGSFERIGQRNARKSGSDRGVVDVLVCLCGRTIHCEFKREDGEGRLSTTQVELARWRLENGVDTVYIEDVGHYAEVMNWCKRHPLDAGRLPHSLVERMSP